MHQKSWERAAVLGLILAAFALYFPPYDWSFVGDDFVQFRYIWVYIERPFSAIELLNPYTLPWYYRPLQNFWFLINRLIFDFNPFPYYAILGVFHAIAISLFYKTAKLFQLSIFATLWVTFFFAIHGHYVDLVGWISSVGILMAAILKLTAVLTYLHYLKSGKSSYLLLTAVSFIFALISHEESFLIPPLLLSIHLIIYRPKLSQFNKREIVFFSLTFIVTAVYLYTQATRPNQTISASEIGAAGYLSHLNIAQIGNFTVDLIGHLTMRVQLQAFLGSASSFVGFFILLLIGYWFWQGNKITKIGLIWFGLHMGFVYFALWSQKPELLAARHFYQGWIGLLWAIGASLDNAFRWAEQHKRQKGRQQRKQAIQRGFTALLIGLGLYFVTITVGIQARWVTRSESYRQAEQDTKAIMSTVTEKTAVFANDFPITPSFLPATIQVWYNQSINTNKGGGLAEISKLAFVSPDYYFFNYFKGRVINAMPELQQHQQTIFLWKDEGYLVYGENIEFIDASEERVAINPYFTITNETMKLVLKATPPEREWAKLSYLSTVPYNSQLRFSVYSKTPNINLQLRLLDTQGSEEVVWETAVSTANEWSEVTIPMKAYWNQPLSFHFESDGEVLWGNPRFVID